jgi:hypothetical protein
LHRRQIGKLKEGTQAIYSRVPTEKELAGTGFVPADYETDEVEVWPENMPAINLFSSISTQWRTGGMGGASGLDYNILFSRMDRMKLPEQEYEWLFDDIRGIEAEALQAINKKD